MDVECQDEMTCLSWDSLSNVILRNMIQYSGNSGASLALGVSSSVLPWKPVPFRVKVAVAACLAISKVKNFPGGVLKVVCQCCL